MRSQKALRPGVAVLAAALLALAWIPAEAAPGNTVQVNETLTATYLNMDNPCTTSVPGENITLQGSFTIAGPVKFSPNGRVAQVDLVFRANFTGVDANWVTYSTSATSFAHFVGTMRDGVTFSAPFGIHPDNPAGNFYLWVQFRFNFQGNPIGGNSNGMVTFNPSTSNGYDHVECAP